MFQKNSYCERTNFYFRTKSTNCQHVTNKQTVVVRRAFLNKTDKSLCSFVALIPKFRENPKEIKIKRQSYLKLDQKSGDLKTKTSVYHKIRPFFRIMAPFKLFRMGQGSTSRSTSQENEPDQPANLVITTTNLNKLTTVMMSSSAHYINIDECDQASKNSSLMSINNDQRALLSSGSTADQIGNLSFSLLSPYFQLHDKEKKTSLFSLCCFCVNQNFRIL